MPPLLRASLLRPFAERLAALGGDPQALAAKLDIDLGGEREAARVTAAQVRAFCEQAARLGGDPALGLNAALERPAGSFGMVEVAARSAPDLRAALGFRIEFGQLLHEGVEVYLDEDAREGRLGFSLPGDRAGLGRHVHEFRLASSVLLIRRAIGTRWNPARAWFSNPEGPTTEALAALLRTRELEFDQPDTGVALTLRDLGRRTRGGDPLVFEYWRRQALRRLPRQRDTHFADELRKRLRAQLARGAPDMAEVARQLHMSPRTLHRRLASEALNFQTVLDELRREQAEREVAQTERSSAELAARLGYADVSTFLRAFKRWTGVSPTEFRRQSRLAAAGAR